MFPESPDLSGLVPCAVQDEKYAFVQFTVRFWTTHTFAAYDSRGKLVAGDPARPLPVRKVLTQHCC